MRLVVLSEAKPGDGLTGEHGLSFYIEHDQKKILFDTGASSLFLENATKLGIDLKGIDLVVLSHGHFDHGDGLRFIRDIPLVCHPSCFVKRYHRGGIRNLGLELSRAEISERFDLQLHREPFQISEHIFFLGEIPRMTGFEAKETPYILEGGEEDFIIDDSGLACITGQGLVVISGCAHSGICNLIRYASEVTGIDTVSAVIGGFHLKDTGSKTVKTIEYLKELQVEKVLPSHCTMEPALSLFHRVFGRNEVKVGQEFTF